jgi:bacillithiol biosynthesis cysteine-adding enzyme BshC
MTTFAIPMPNRIRHIPYRQTNCFSDLVLDYLDRDLKLQDFYSYPISLKGVMAAVEERKKSPIDRHLLHKHLEKQYQHQTKSIAVTENLDRLKEENCFTITTAHQNNLFTGPLYFIYKILHVIKLTSHLNQQLPTCQFVPVFYMGSEDADLAELNHAHVEGVRLTWDTSQQGAVGRMVIDEKLILLLDRLQGQLTVLPHGEELMSQLRACYKLGITIAEATFSFVNELFGRWGLIVINPDDSALKRRFSKVVRDDLWEQLPASMLQQTVAKLESNGYHAQANARPINTFYLEDGLRQRIEKKGDSWQVQGTDKVFNETELTSLLESSPEKFSPNVILRGLYQSMILPDVAFIGGGGEIAYWLEFKQLFAHYHVPMPVLVLRNSFLVVKPALQKEIRSLGLSYEDLFEELDQLHLRLISTKEKESISLQQEIASLQALYASLSQKAAQLDITLQGHVGALAKKSQTGLEGLEKKMSRALKRKHTESLQKAVSIKSALFPGGGLQERYENVLPLLAQYGDTFLELLLAHSLQLEQEFTVVELS